MLRFIAISGTTGVSENHYIYEADNDMIVVDCGVGFPDPEMFGVDLTIPDFSYLLENKNKLKGIVITHGHEDHLGALPFLLKDINVPVYCTKLVAGFIKDKLADYKVKNSDLRVFDPEKDSISLGSFRVTPFRISHSVPDSVGLVIETPEGKIFHVADFKFDWTPVDGRPFDIRRCANLASGQVLALACDCLGATTPGYTESEIEIERIVGEIVEKTSGAVFFTTISSNISRIKQAINVSQRLGRKVVFIGRSIVRKSGIAQNLGYLDYPSDVVIQSKDAEKLDPGKMMYVISGCYGQPGSALYRLSLGEHEFLRIEKGDAVIFSADPAPPGSKDNVDFVVDKLFEKGIEVHYYDMQEDLHVSGHGSIQDIQMLMGTVRPKYFIPIGGTTRHMRAYSILAQKMDASEADVFELKEGDSVEFSRGSARKGKRLDVRSVLVDGLGIGDVGQVVLRDRRLLAEEGIAIAIIQLEASKERLVSTPEIISRGFVYAGKNQELLLRAGKELQSYIQRGVTNRHTVRTKSIDFLEKFFFEETGRRPMVLPVVVEI